MTKFLIFGGETYYADGGAFDLLSSFEGNVEDAKLKATSYIGKYSMVKLGEHRRYRKIEWVHIYNVETSQVVFSENSPFGNGAMIVDIVDNVPDDYLFQ